MRTFFAFLILIPLCLTGLAADISSKVTPRYKAQIVCFNGAIDSDSSYSAKNFKEDGTFYRSSKMTSGLPGAVSEIEWTFVERNGDRDVYRFTRRFPSDTAAAKVTSRTIQFNKSRIIVFQDKFQTIVMESPKK